MIKLVNPRHSVRRLQVSLTAGGEGVKPQSHPVQDLYIQHHRAGSSLHRGGSWVKDERIMSGKGGEKDTTGGPSWPWHWLAKCLELPKCLSSLPWWRGGAGKIFQGCLQKCFSLLCFFYFMRLNIYIIYLYAHAL